jgi:TPR repeat protein
LIIHYSLDDAAKKGVHSAYFYLGNMYLDGKHVKKNDEMALDCFIKGASKNNAYCYFELSRLYGEGEIVEKNTKLQFIYLKRSA